MIKLSENFYAGVDDEGNVALFDMVQGTRLIIQEKNLKRTRKFLKNPHKQLSKFEEATIEEREAIERHGEKEDALEQKAEADREDQVIYDRTLS